MRAWAGYLDGKLHWDIVDDFFGGKNITKRPAIFTNKRHAKKQYHDVRRVEITEVDPNDGEGA